MIWEAIGSYFIKALRAFRRAGFRWVLTICFLDVKCNANVCANLRDVIFDYRCFFKLWRVILETFWTPFSSFWRFGCQVASGSEKCWKSDPKNQKTVLRFHKNSVLFRTGFFSYFLKCSEEASFGFVWPRCPKWGLLGNTFPDILQQSWKGETYGFVYTKP